MVAAPPKSPQPVVPPAPLPPAVEEKEFKCTAVGCSKQYAHKSTLSRHIRGRYSELLQIAFFVPSHPIGVGSYVEFHGTPSQSDLIDAKKPASRDASEAEKPADATTDTTTEASDLPAEPEEIATLSAGDPNDSASRLPSVVATAVSVPRPKHGVLKVPCMGCVLALVSAR